MEVASSAMETAYKLEAGLLHSDIWWLGRVIM